MDADAKPLQPVSTGLGDSAAWAAGSDAPEKPALRIGFMPLTDCASLVTAAMRGFDRKHGLRFVPVKVASWAAVRDKLVSGELDMAHVPCGLVYGLHLGVGGPKQDMAVLMTLNRNGQALTLSRDLADRGAIDAASLAALVARQPRDYRFAQTFPTATHALWLYYWLASAGIDPLRDITSITVPPPQMVGHMRMGQLDGFSAGEPWNHRAVLDGVGFTVATSQQIWPDHPEKVLGSTGAFVRRHPHAARAAIMAVLEASRWLDAHARHREWAAAALADPVYVGTPQASILPRLLGQYDDGLGRRWRDRHRMAFFDGGAVNYPYPSDGMWFLTQHKRWGLLREHPDYLGVARQISQTGLYAEAAAALQVPLPAQPMRRSRFIDGGVWDGGDPAAYADAFAIRGARHGELRAA